MKEEAHQEALNTGENPAALAHGSRNSSINGTSNYILDKAKKNQTGDAKRKEEKEKFTSGYEDLQDFDVDPKELEEEELEDNDESQVILQACLYLNSRNLTQKLLIYLNKKCDYHYLLLFIRSEIPITASLDMKSLGNFCTRWAIDWTWHAILSSNSRALPKWVVIFGKLTPLSGISCNQILLVVSAMMLPSWPLKCVHDKAIYMSVFIQDDLYLILIARSLKWNVFMTVVASLTTSF